MNILEIGIARGIEEGREEGMKQGKEEGRLKALIENVDSAIKNFNIDLQRACEGLGTSVEEYEKAKQYFLTHETVCADSGNQ
ncbi:MAG: hypothetical protein K2J99_17795 [Lachnospiraceae bacterium]|nr:hypothetical protein [Lachnospiraceae bacterium]